MAGWTDDMDKVLTDLFRDPKGLSFRQIAERMAHFKVSRNAVIGRAARLKLMRGDPATKAKPKQRKQRMFIVKKQHTPATVAEAVEIVTAETTGVEFLQLTGCRAPTIRRDDGVQMFCNEPRVTQHNVVVSSYCPAHHRIFKIPRAEMRGRRHG